MLDKVLENALGPCRVRRSDDSYIVTAKNAVILASEFVRAQEKIRSALPANALVISRFHTIEEDRFGNRLVEGVTLYILIPH